MPRLTVKVSVFLISACAVALFLCGQTASPPVTTPASPPSTTPVTTPAAPPEETAETTTHDAPVTFQSKVNLVPVPVVVRDKKSQAVGTLTKDDFQIFDNGKLQAISKFSVEKTGVVAESKPIAVETADGSAPVATGKPAPVIANRFVAYVFDDEHFNMQDLVTSRLAALKHFDTLDNVNSRAAVFTTSGVSPEDFTSDRQKLKAALMRIVPRTKAENPQIDCPYLPYYTADLIANHNDSMAIQAASIAAMSCPSPPLNLQMAQTQVMSDAMRTMSIGEFETHSTISALQSMVKRIAAMPGQRTLVLVSPGFIFPTQQQDISQLIDLAIRMNVVINAIDGRGLYVDSRYDASRPNAPNSALAQYEEEEAREAGDTLGTLAEGTGGTYFANNNDLLEGFRRTGSQPEFTYMLGFSPQNLKNDGSFHSIKVKLRQSAGLNVQSRRGYFAPKHAEGVEDKAKDDIEEALFTREEMTDFPLSMNTQFFKSSDVAAKISIVAKVGLKKFRFRKADGRNKDQITLVAALFDRDGNYLSAKQTIVDLRFRDDTLEKHINNGFAVRTSFEDVKPGVYVVRLVARDTEGQMISATNGAIEVP